MVASNGQAALAAALAQQKTQQRQPVAQYQQQAQAPVRTRDRCDTDVDEEGLAELEVVKKDCLRICESLLKAAARSQELPPILRDVALSLVVLEHRLRADWRLLTTGQPRDIAESVVARPRPALILGGVASLFHNVRLALGAVEQSVLSMPGWGGRISEVDFLAASTELLAVLGGFGFIFRRFFFKSRRIQRWMLRLATMLRTRFPTSLAVGPVAAGFWLAWLVWRIPAIRTEKLNSAHNELLMMLRVWSAVTTTVEDNLARAKDGVVPPVSSFALIPQPRESDTCENLKPVSRKILEFVPLPYALPIWRRGIHGVMAYGLDVGFGAFGAAFWCTDWIPKAVRPIIATPLAAAFAPVLAVRPLRASSIAAQTRARMTPDCCLTAMYCTAENPLAKAAARLFLIPRSVAWRPVEHVNGTKVRFFSRLPPNGTPRPVVIYFHGGGFICDLSNADLGVVGKIASLPCSPIVAVPEYPLAVKHPFPAALVCLKDISGWLRNRFPQSRMAFVGESAGGNLAIATTLKLILDGTPDEGLPAGIICGYPPCHPVQTASPSRIVNGSDPMLGTGILRMCIDSYAKGADPAVEPLISPGIAPNDLLKRLPPVRLQVGGLDPILDETIDFAMRLRRCEVPLELKVFRTLPHGFWALDDVMRDADVAVRQAVAWTEKVLTGGV
eukprot:TRINITY_DN47695_c0_g2_i1.p1 TRINITY_DN47695_c0_g2~~TRINITY_DN47695_c0_g2_i1.p1  ORF type:complete len:672 (-),score=99.65 TRINITY_DN47695_c0_g2_i1:187-2202(-)